MKDALPIEWSVCRCSLCPSLLQLLLSAILVFGGLGAESTSFTQSAKVGVTTLLQPHQMPLGSGCGLEQSAAFILVLCVTARELEAFINGYFLRDTG